MQLGLAVILIYLDLGENLQTFKGLACTIPTAVENGNLNLTTTKRKHHITESGSGKAVTER
eukprot:3251075-Amphidinium_carterae.1